MPRVKLFDETEVLEKAMHLFWKQGYYATSIQDLVNHLGINRASLYDTYGGKKKLFESAFTHYTTGNTNRIEQFLNTQPNVKQGFKQLFQMAIQQSCSDPDRKGCMVVNTSIEFIPNEQEFAPLIEANKQRFIQLFHQYLHSGVENGEIAKGKNLEAIATLFFTFYNGLQVVTKVEFDAGVFGKSVDALLLVLD
ncbi:MAG: TetR/AcrR family transcriptional regulator [Bacteroidota bacterium]